ncbi:biotin/lipoyl-containing protein [Sunxiuqinia indica]|uniref:biotin/lipoyl-containing protein n=1 Tax=Sunxiuqinia indica TaxID=2692584 RepID=UPI00135C52D5|nr:biotin/lipoyl-containing protein [Sunxiuqinia indica]
MAEKKVEEKQYDTIIVHSAVYKTEYTQKYINRPVWEYPNENHIFSFMPGSIIDVHVKPGEKLKEGDSLLILEAMKMHNNVQMPFDGKIVKIHVKPGQKIPKKHLMLEIKRL